MTQVYRDVLAQTAPAILAAVIVFAAIAVCIWWEERRARKGRE